MRIVAYNPGHDGGFACLEDGRLVLATEAEKDSGWRYSPTSNHDVFAFLAELDGPPDVLCVGGWWHRDAPALGRPVHAGYRGIDPFDVLLEERRLLGRRVRWFSSSHERSHLLCALGLSGLPRGTPCYALVWEGEIGTFYAIDEAARPTLLAEVMSEPGNRYAALYGVADPTFPKDAPFSRFSDAGKLMALASHSRRDPTDAEGERLLGFLLDAPHARLTSFEGLRESPYLDVGLDDPGFRNLCGVLSDRIFDRFASWAERNLRRDLPLVVAGGCGLNCDWNTAWVESGLFASVFVPPVANDSGSAIGTALDARLALTGDPGVEWSVYAGTRFRMDRLEGSGDYEVRHASADAVAELLAAGLVLGWVQGRCEIGPRALGNRSILAAPFKAATRDRLNRIKQREGFRPIAPVCLEEDGAEWFGCSAPSPHMLYTHMARTEALAAVTHVNGSARIQTVSPLSNPPLHGLLRAFRERTGYGVLCNTSLNFNGRGFINGLADLSRYAIEHGLDGFVVDDRVYLVRSALAERGFEPAGGAPPAVSEMPA